MTDRRAGSVGVNVDLAVNPERRLGAIGVNVDYIPAPPPTPITRSVTQAQAVSLSRILSLPRVISTTVAQSVSLQYQVETSGIVYPLTGSATQATQTSLARASALNRQTSTSTSVRLTYSHGLLLPVATVGQAVTLLLGRGYQRTVTATQATAVSRQRKYFLTRATTGNRRVSMNVSLGRQLGRTLRATIVTRTALRRTISLTRRVTVGTVVSGSGLPVQLQVLATIQTRSLALGLAETLTRAISVATAPWLEQVLGLERTAVVPTVATRTMAATLTRDVLQATSVSLDVLDVTPHYEVTVALSVSQSVALSMAGTGRPARGFVVSGREAEFVVSGRRGDFAVARRGVRFTVEAR